MTEEDRGRALIYYFYRPYEPKKLSVENVKEFSADTVLPWMERCVDSGGFPMFRARYRGNKAFFYHGSPAAYGICWGDEENKVPSVLFTDVPSGLWISMLASGGDWKKVLRYFRDNSKVPPDEIERLEKKIRSVFA